MEKVESQRNRTSRCGPCRTCFPTNGIRSVGPLCTLGSKKARVARKSAGTRGHTSAATSLCRVKREPLCSCSHASRIPQLPGVSMVLVVHGLVRTEPMAEIPGAAPLRFFVFFFYLHALIDRPTASLQLIRVCNRERAACSCGVSLEILCS